MLLFTDCRVKVHSIWSGKFEISTSRLEFSAGMPPHVGFPTWKVHQLWLCNPWWQQQRSYLYYWWTKMQTSYMLLSFKCFWIKSCLHVGKMWVQPGRIESTNKEEKIDPAFNGWYFVFLRSHFEQRLKQTPTTVCQHWELIAFFYGITFHFGFCQSFMSLV